MERKYFKALKRAVSKLRVHVTKGGNRF